MRLNAAERSGIQRDTAGCSGMQRDAAGCSGMQRDAAGCSGMQRYACHLERWLGDKETSSASRARGRPEQPPAKGGEVPSESSETIQRRF